MVFCRSPDLEGNDTMIYTIEKVCLEVPASASQRQTKIGINLYLQWLM